METVGLIYPALQSHSSYCKIDGMVFDAHDLEKYPKWVQSGYTNSNDINLINFNKLSKQITEIEFNDCRGLKGKSLSKLPNHLKALTFRCVTLNSSSTESMWGKTLIILIF